MKIVHLTAENVKKIKVVEIAPDGSVVQITGPNGAGKSSVLDSILYALAGGKALPKQPIRRGEKEAKIRLDLGDIIVTRKFSEGKDSTLIVEGKTGARYSSPQRMLDELLGAISFDPLAFSRMEPKQQFEMLRKVSKLEIDLEAIAGQNKTDFENRSDINRRAKAVRAQAQGITLPAELPTEVVDVDALLKQLTEASRTNTEIERKRAAREAATNDVAKLRTEADRLEAEAKRMRDRASELEEQIKAAPPLEDLVDVDNLRLSIEQGRVVNALIDKSLRRADLETEAKTLEDQAKALSEKIEARDKARNDALADAKMPIANISLGEGVVLLNGLPFEQASSAEQLRTSVAIAMATNPKLKVMLIREGGLLDENGMKILGEMTAAADYQCWIETVHANGPVAVEMVDGAAKNAEQASTSTPATKADASADTRLL